MTDNIMFIPAIVVLALEAVALAFLVWAWRKAKKESDNEEDQWKH